MICPNCGEEIPSGKKFCGFCGAKIQQPDIEQKKFAPEQITPEQDVPESIETEPLLSEPITPQKEKSHPRPKWLFWVIPLLVIVVGLVVAFAFNWIPQQMFWGWFKGSSTEAVQAPDEDAISMMIAGTWVGEIGNEGWSATLEVTINEVCDIGSICGTYRLLEYDSRGELELVEVVGFGYRFLEHPIEEENISGPGYQTMNLSTLEDEKLVWSFRQELPNGDITTSSGILDRK